MTYQFNGVELTLQPTSGRWMPRIILGTTGAGHVIYPAVREFQLSWGIMSTAEYDQLRDFYRQVGITGTVVATLPDINASTYTYRNYSGCTVREPEAGQYFAEHVRDVRMEVINIHV